MKETLQGTALLVAVTHGFLAWSLAGANPSWAQDKEALDICLNSEREPGVRVEACRTAAEQGLASAQFSLGNMYRTGEGVPQDYGEAVKWFRLAADQGNASAQFSLGYMYSTGEGVPQDDGEAVKWFRLAADQGNASAQFSLGNMYRTGEGVLPWCINTGKSLIPLTLLFLAQKRNLLIPLELSGVMHQGT